MSAIVPSTPFSSNCFFSGIDRLSVISVSKGHIVASRDTEREREVRFRFRIRFIHWSIKRDNEYRWSSLILAHSSNRISNHLMKNTKWIINDDRRLTKKKRSPVLIMLFLRYLLSCPIVYDAFRSNIHEIQKTDWNSLIAWRCVALSSYLRT